LFIDAEAATGIFENPSQDEYGRFAFFQRELRTNSIFVPLKR